MFLKLESIIDQYGSITGARVCRSKVLRFLSYPLSSLEWEEPGCHVTKFVESRDKERMGSPVLEQRLSLAELQVNLAMGCQQPRIMSFWSQIP